MRLKRVLLVLAAALGLSTAWAQVGVFTRFSEFLGAEFLGVQFRTGNLRLSVGLPYFFGLAGSADWILGQNPIPAQGVDLSYYYGGGVSVGLLLVYTAVPWANLHGLLGLEWRPPESNLGVFLEPQLGVGFLSYGYFGPYLGSRLGVNFY